MFSSDRHGRQRDRGLALKDKDGAMNIVTRHVERDHATYCKAWFNIVAGIPKQIPSHRDDSINSHKRQLLTLTCHTLKPAPHQIIASLARRLAWDNFELQAAPSALLTSRQQNSTLRRLQQYRIPRRQPGPNRVTCHHAAHGRTYSIFPLLP